MSKSDSDTTRMSQNPASSDAAKRDIPPVPTDPWVAQALISPVTHHGSKEDCEAWGDALRGRDVYVVDADGNLQMVGVVREIMGGPFEWTPDHRPSLVDVGIQDLPIGNAENAG